MIPHFIPDFRGVALAAALGALLAGCVPAPERPPMLRAVPEGAQFPAERYRRPDAAGRVYWLDPEASEIHIFAGRAGLLASQGHNHVIVARGLEGAVFLPDAGLDGARVDLAIPVEDLLVDPPALRQSLGEEYGSALSAQDRERTRRNMLGEEVLDAAKYPRIGVSSQAVTGELPALKVRAAIELHGTRRELDVPVHVEIDGVRLAAVGSLRVAQSEFGIEPFSVAAGLLRVADEVEIEFELVGTEEQGAD